MVGSGRSHNYHISNFSLEGRWVSVQYLFDEYISLSLFLIMKNYDKKWKGKDYFRESYNNNNNVIIVGDYIHQSN